MPDIKLPLLGVYFSLLSLGPAVVQSSSHSPTAKASKQQSPGRQQMRNGSFSNICILMQVISRVSCIQYEFEHIIF